MKSVHVQAPPLAIFYKELTQYIAYNAYVCLPQLSTVTGTCNCLCWEMFLMSGFWQEIYKLAYVMYHTVHLANEPYQCVHTHVHACY